MLKPDRADKIHYTQIHRSGHPDLSPNLDLPDRYINLS